MDKRTNKKRRNERNLNVGNENKNNNINMEMSEDLAPGTKKNKGRRNK